MKVKDANVLHIVRKLVAVCVLRKRFKKMDKVLNGFCDEKKKKLDIGAFVW